MSIFVGKLIRKMNNKNNKEFYVGSVGKFPIIANWGTKKPDDETLYLKIDTERIKYLENREAESKKETK